MKIENELSKTLINTLLKSSSNELSLYVGNSKSRIPEGLYLCIDDTEQKLYLYELFDDDICVIEEYNYNGGMQTINSIANRYRQDIYLLVDDMQSFMEHYTSTYGNRLGIRAIRCLKSIKEIEDKVKRVVNISDIDSYKLINPTDSNNIETIVDKSVDIGNMSLKPGDFLLFLDYEFLEDKLIREFSILEAEVADDFSLNVINTYEEYVSLSKSSKDIAIELVNLIPFILGKYSGSKDSVYFLGNDIIGDTTLIYESVGCLQLLSNILNHKINIVDTSSKHFRDLWFSTYMSDKNDYASLHSLKSNLNMSDSTINDECKLYSNNPRGSYKQHDSMFDVVLLYNAIQLLLQNQLAK